MAAHARVAAAKEILAGLSPEERTQFREMVRTRVRQAPAPLHDPETGKALAIPRMPLMRSEHLDPGTPEGKVNNALMLLTGVGGVVRGLAAGASRAGVPGLLGAGGQTLKRLGLWTGAGAAVGASGVPIIGEGGPKQGAQLGLAMGVGRTMPGMGTGGTGALWKHGRKKGAIEWLAKWLGKKLGADDLDELAKVADEVASVPAGMSGTPVTAAAVPRAVAPAARAAPGSARGASTMPAPQAAPAPAPAPAAAPVDAATATRRALPWSRKGGKKAQEALLEHTGHIPRAVGPDDVAAMRARGATQEQIEAALLRAAQPPKTAPFGGPIGSRPPPPKGPGPPRLPTPTLPRPTKNQVDRAVRDSQAGLRDKIRQIDEAGNLRTTAQGKRTLRRGYEQRDIVDDFENGFEIDPNAEYVLNQSKLKAFTARLRDRVERELTEELALAAPAAPRGGESALARLVGVGTGQAATRAAAPSVPAGARSLTTTAREAAREFGLRAGSKVHNITVGAKVLQWFPTPDKAKGAIRSLAERHGWKRIDVGKYRTPEGTVAELSWTEALR